MIIIEFSILPFGFIGVIGTFALHGKPLGFIAFIEVIGLMGVLVNDSLVLVQFVNHLRKRGEKGISFFSSQIKRV